MAGILEYWGKARPPDEGAELHRLAYHCLDVAAVGAVLLDHCPAYLERLSQISGCSADSLRTVLPFHLALHDLGKFSEPFQELRPDLVARLQGPRASSRACDIRHDSLGYLLWKEWAADAPSAPERDLLELSFPLRALGLHRSDHALLVQPWMAAVLGHHGRPPEERSRPPEVFSVGADEIPARSRADAAEFVRSVHALLQPSPLDVDPADEDLEPRLRSSSWWVAGFTILCDWLGSRAAYVEEELPLAGYLSRAFAWAEQAVDESGLAASKPRAYGGIPELLPADVAAAPTPLQSKAAEVPLGRGPQLFVLEDLTGSGKTEAALILAHRLMTEGRADGIYFALPTMATANAMAPRVSGLVERLFSGTPSFLLTHSGPRLTEQDRLRIAGTVELSPELGESAGSAAATAWLSDNRKKALLAQLGVGTIDQALLAVLQSRHAALRLFGLHQRVLVVDEVHACDAYMLGLLEALLRAHAALGGSAILLSATLPGEQRRRLASAFARGLGRRSANLAGSDAYPLLTSVDESGAAEVPVEPRSGTPRTLPIRWHETEEQVVERLVGTAREGCCACWVRNSVADALEAHRLLAERLPADRLTLFHARFALADRLRIEQAVVDRFGKGARAERAGHVVVATQVVEQSLDIDFDVLISDVCPIDLVIQRAGRLQRHGARHPGRPRAVLEIFAPAWSADPPESWLGGPFRRTAKVYDDPGVLWRTMSALRAAKVLSTPEGARPLIEAVYGEEAAPLPDSLTRRSDQAYGKRLADASLAEPATIKLGQGYQRVGADWSSEARTPTRLGEPTTTLRLARVDADGSVHPWSEAIPKLRWQLSQLSVARRLVAGAGEGDAALRAAVVVEQGLTDDDVVTVLLRPTGGGAWIGDAVAERRIRGEPRLVPVRLIYSEREGLGVVSPSEEAR